MRAFVFQGGMESTRLGRVKADRRVSLVLFLSLSSSFSTPVFSPPTSPTSTPGPLPIQPRLSRSSSSTRTESTLPHLEPLLSFVLLSLPFRLPSFSLFQPPMSTHACFSFQASGLDTISYTPPRSTTALADWPTLGSMIDSGKRIVTFMDHDADITTIPYIIDGQF